MFCQECGAEAGNSERFCRNCGASLTSITAESQPNRRRSRLLRVLFWGIGIFVGLALLHTFVTLFIGQSNQEGSSAVEQNAPVGTPASTESPQTSQPAPAEALPEDESEFISMITSFVARYEQAANEFQKSTVRKERAAAIARMLPTRTVDAWVGNVSEMHTTSDGLGVLSVKLPGNIDIEVETMNNGLSDIGEHTLIPNGSALYSQVSSLAVGDEVNFSGRFSPGDNDYIEEISLTEEGSMTAPGFVFTFAWVAKARPDHPPNAP